MYSLNYSVIRGISHNISVFFCECEFTSIFNLHSSKNHRNEWWPPLHHNSSKQMRRGGKGWRQRWSSRLGAVSRLTRINGSTLPIVLVAVLENSLNYRGCCIDSKHGTVYFRWMIFCKEFFRKYPSIFRGQNFRGLKFLPYTGHPCITKSNFYYFFFKFNQYMWIKFCHSVEFSCLNSSRVSLIQTSAGLIVELVLLLM